MDREAGQVTVYRISGVGHDLVTSHHLHVNRTVPSVTG